MSIARICLGKNRVARGVPVREGGPDGIRTWGELDALVDLGGLPSSPQDGLVAHVELAVKFYLQVRPEDAWRWCVGPGLRDRLDLKGPRTFLRQLPLSSTALGVDAVRRIFPHVASIVPVAFVKGTVFYRAHPSARHPDEAWQDGMTPVGLSPHHSKGWWIPPHEEALEHLRSAWPTGRLLVLPRLRWLGGWRPEVALAHGETWVQFLARLPERLAACETRSECLMIGIHSDQDGRQVSRGFIVTRRFLAGAGS